MQNPYESPKPISYESPPVSPFPDPARPTWARFGVLLFLCSLAFVLYIDRVCIGQAGERHSREPEAVERTVQLGDECLHHRLLHLRGSHRPLGRPLWLSRRHRPHCGLVVDFHCPHRLGLRTLAADYHSVPVRCGRGGSISQCGPRGDTLVPGDRARSLSAARSPPLRSSAEPSRRCWQSGSSASSAGGGPLRFLDSSESFGRRHSTGGSGTIRLNIPRQAQPSGLTSARLRPGTRPMSPFRGELFSRVPMYGCSARFQMVSATLFLHACFCGIRPISKRGEGFPTIRPLGSPASPFPAGAVGCMLGGLLFGLNSALPAGPQMVPPHLRLWHTSVGSRRPLVRALLRKRRGRHCLQCRRPLPHADRYSNLVDRRRRNQRQAWSLHVGAHELDGRARRLHHDVPRRPRRGGPRNEPA